jgi:hypothetical protein
LLSFRRARAGISFQRFYAPTISNRLADFLPALMICKQLKLDVQLYTLIHLLKVNLFEKASIEQMVRLAMRPEAPLQESYQRELFGYNFIPYRSALEVLISLRTNRILREQLLKI